MARRLQPAQPEEAYGYLSTFDAYNIGGHEIFSNDQYGWKVIAHISFYDREKCIGYWSAYRGYTNWSDNYIRENGDKISKTAAESLFPTLARTPGLKYYDR